MLRRCDARDKDYPAWVKDQFKLYYNRDIVKTRLFGTIH